MQWLLLLAVSGYGQPTTTEVRATTLVVTTASRSLPSNFSCCESPKKQTGGAYGPYGDRVGVVTYNYSSNREV